MPGIARRARPILAVAALSALLALAACGGAPATPGSQLAATSVPATLPGLGHSTVPASAAANRVTLLAWPEFGLNPQRTNATSASAGLTPANVRRLHRHTLALPGTVDSSPILLHAVRVAGAVRDVIVVTTTYGRTLAIDPASGRALWDFTAPGARGLVGGPQITSASPAADPGGRYVYAASPDGVIHKLALADGHEAPGWPVSVTRDATREKLAAAIGIDGPDVLVTTGGYLGDTPPYQGHVILIDRASGRVATVLNTLCANRRELIVPSSCPGSDSAIWARAGAVLERDGRVLVATGNGPYDGRENFGDSVIELDPGTLDVRQAYTPTDQAQLNRTDLDLGSSAPALLGDGLVLEGGKDGVMRVLALAALDGAPPSAPRRLGGELQQLPTPGGQQLLTAPAVWHHGGATTVFVADGAGTTAYGLRGGRLHAEWGNGHAGTSPVLVGGLLYVYDPSGGGLRVYDAGSGRELADLAAGSGHWNSPIVADRVVVLPEGDANDHASNGILDIYRLR